MATQNVSVSTSQFIPRSLTTDAIASAKGDALHAMAKEDIIKTLAASLGFGVAAGGAKQVYDMFSSKKKKESPDEFQFPVQRKLAFDGRHADSPQGLPYYYPGIAAAAVAGGLGGYKLTDSFFSKMKSNKTDEQLSKAKADFERALALATTKQSSDHLNEKKSELKSNYLEAIQPNCQDKSASELARSLDRFVDVVEKAASSGGDNLGRMLGGYLTYAAISPVIAGKIMYDVAQRKKQDKEDARNLAQHMVPTTLQAVPSRPKGADPLEPLV